LAGQRLHTAHVTVCSVLPWLRKRVVTRGHLCTARTEVNQRRSDRPVGI